MNQFPTDFIRLNRILGNPKANPPIPAIIPASKSTFWLGVKEGHYPHPVKLGKRCTAWRVDDSRRYIESIGGKA